MKEELILNEKPFMRAYPQYAFIDAIINNNQTNSSLLCSIVVPNNDKYYWNYERIVGDIKNRGDIVEIYRQGFGAHAGGKFFCDVEMLQEFVFHISYMQYTNVWDSITFFIKLKDNMIKYEFNIFCCGDWGLDISGTNESFWNNRSNSKNPTWFKVQISRNTIQLYCSFEGEKWSVLRENQLQEEYITNFSLGFDVHLCENQYFKWICNNFIQMRFDGKSGKPLDYTGFVIRDWKNYTIHPLVKFSYDKESMICRRGLWNYITENVCNNRYMEMWLDEFFIEGLNAYQQFSYVHESLVYGINEKEKKVKIMSFKNGKPVLLSVSIENFEIAWKKAQSNNFITQVFEYAPDQGGYGIDVEHIIEEMKSYLSGENRMINLRYFSQIENGVYGIKIYDEILGNPKSQEVFLTDIRIAYVLLEHKQCMRYRIQYLYEDGILDENSYIILEKQMEEILNKAMLIMHLIMKLNLRFQQNEQLSVLRYLSELRNLEGKCYQRLIMDLQSHKPTMKK